MVHADLTEQQKKDNKRFPRYIVAFFIMLALLDGVFVYLAASTHRGVVTDNAYQKGLAYNKTIQAQEKQTALGWHGTLNYQQPNLSFQLLDKEKAPLSQANVTAYLSRTTQMGHDFQIKLTPRSAGQYEVVVVPPLKGLWTVTVLAQWNQQRYQMTKKIVLK